ncbi:MAG: TetR/AcrR family transcriptional regulator [Jatrophihabitans sp.]|nr:MAG: TetR/AcrR family transcriptional regulator [Jatrophihabitans sp.]
MPKIIASTLDQHREQMREHIFDSFAKLLSTQGYVATTLAHVAADAGIGRTAMYNYYPDKESLLIGYTAYDMGRYIEHLLAELATAANPLDQLRVFIRVQVTQLATSHVASSMLVNVVSEAGRRKLTAHVAPLWGTLRMILADAVADGYLPEVDLDELLPLVTASIVGRRPVDLKPAELERVIDATTLYVLRGLGARVDASGRPRRVTKRAAHREPTALRSVATS